MSKIKKFTQQKTFVTQTKRSHISLSWQYMTSNKKFTLDYFADDVRSKSQAMEGIFELIHEISSHDWTEILSRRKKSFGGCESIWAKQIKFSPSGYTLSDDEKIFVFRFKHKFRLLGIQDKDILYVIGYDFDHSAYNHGS